MCSSIHLPPYLKRDRNSPQQAEVPAPSDTLPGGSCSHPPLDRGDSAAGLLRVLRGISAVAPSTWFLRRCHPGPPEAAEEEGNPTRGPVPSWSGNLPEAEVVEVI